MLSTNARTDRDTPQSFVDRMAAGLRAYAQAKRDAVPHGTGYSELPTIAGRVDMLASYLGALDVADARLYANMQAASLLRDPDNIGQWRPGVEMSRVLSRLGTNGEFDADRALTELTCAATEDVLSAGRHALSLAVSERDRLRAEVDELADIKAAVDHQKARLGVAQMSKQTDLAAAARDARNAVLAAAREETPTPTRVEEAPEELPTGVRRRGNGFQAYARIAGTQLQRQFATVDDAAIQAEQWTRLRDNPEQARGIRRDRPGECWQAWYVDKRGEVQTKTFGDRDDDQKLAIAWAHAQPGLFDAEPVAA